MGDFQMSEPKQSRMQEEDSEGLIDRPSTTRHRKNQFRVSIWPLTHEAPGCTEQTPRRRSVLVLQRLDDGEHSIVYKTLVPAPVRRFAFPHEGL